MKKAQMIQNKGLRFAYGDKYSRGRELRRTSKELHRKAKFEPLNLILTDIARKIWQSIERSRRPTAKLLHDNLQIRSLQFPSSLKDIHMMPQPIGRC